MVERVGVGVDHEAVVHVNLQAVTGGDRRDAEQRQVDGRRHVELVRRDLDRAALRAPELHELAYEPAELVGVRRRSAQELATSFVGKPVPVQQHRVDKALDGREWRAQLVGDEGEELALLLVGLGQLVCHRVLALRRLGPLLQQIALPPAVPRKVRRGAHDDSEAQREGQRPDQGARLGDGAGDGRAEARVSGSPAAAGVERTACHLGRVGVAGRGGRRDG